LGGYAHCLEKLTDLFTISYLSDLRLANTVVKEREIDTLTSQFLNNCLSYGLLSSCDNANKAVLRKELVRHKAFSLLVPLWMYQLPISTVRTKVISIHIHNCKEGKNPRGFSDIKKLVFGNRTKNRRRDETTAEAIRGKIDHRATNIDTSPTRRSAIHLKRRKMWSVFKSYHGFLIGCRCSQMRFCVGMLLLG